MKGVKNVPSISVLMGIYNEKKKEQVKVAISSILNQSYCDFEFIICDDGSPEEFFLWLQQYCRIDKRIRLLRNERNEGLSKALNRCLAEANGKYIARMDADDVSLPNRFERQINFLEKHSEYALAGCAVGLIDDKGIWGERVPVEKPQKTDFLWTSPFIHPSIMMKKSILQYLNGYATDAYIERTEDYELFMRLYATGKVGYNLQEKLLLYREDRNAFIKRKYRYRINEAKVRYVGFGQLGIRKGNYKYIIKPLVIGVLPGFVMQRFHKRQFGEKENDRDCNFKL